MGESNLIGIMTILGPIVLLGLLIWAVVRNKQSRVPKDVTERATEANYEAEDRAAKNDQA
ncbi:hypothetical protein [Sphingomonas edaphi]|jgi:hypothetical protein|uniref:Uncharacterized protein n=1 Tax=Sphingomonas edaphi TaxID=2315689 RepID=A0A418PZF8_9SPHN|nr:hypothetical protein [Sphingomonas edaphi]RIX29064.1 hypothetical protein D3M59_06990 [Sphingomonas edaphi]